MMEVRTVVKNVKVVTLFLIVSAIFFEANADCGSFHSLSTKAVNISSPNYPGDYSNDEHCAWNFETKPGDLIKLIFYDFRTEHHSSCGADYVAVYDGNTRNELLGKFCGSAVPSPVISKTNKMLVIFHSDSSDIYRGFTASASREFGFLYLLGIENSKRNLADFLMNTRDGQTRTTNKWGTDISRTAVTLFLNDQHVFNIGSRTGEEIALELSLQLLSKLALKKTISTKDLALYINALTVTCFNPKDFYGVNLVEELRKRVNKSNNIHPFSILTLCNAGDSMTIEDVQKLQEQYSAYVRPVWTDVQAMVVMALSCIHSRSDLNLDKEILNDMVSELKEKQHTNGTVDDWKITTLVVQALLSTGDYRTDFNMSAAIRVIVDDVSNHTNVQDIYYVLPILNDMSLVNISSDHCGAFMQTETRDNLSDNPAERIQVQITVITGDNMDFFRTWKLKVPSNFSFYEALESLSALEPTYKVQYRISEGKPYVVGLGNMLDDPEDATFWFTYSKLLSKNSETAQILNLIELSPADIPINATHEMILWYRSGILENSEED